VAFGSLKNTGKMALVFSDGLLIPLPQRADFRTSNFDTGNEFLMADLSNQDI
jgi:hypothetical protein